MAAASDNDRPAGEAGAPPDFESALTELERIVQQLEGGALGLEQSLVRFEEGIGLLRQCYETLERAEQRIELLTGSDSGGNPVTTPFPPPEGVEVSVEVVETRVEIAPDRRAAPELPSAAGRGPQDDPESREERPTLF